MLVGFAHATAGGLMLRGLDRQAFWPAGSGNIRYLQQILRRTGVLGGDQASNVAQSRRSAASNNAFGPSPLNHACFSIEPASSRRTSMNSR